MRLFQKALHKAEKEGKIDSKILPWEETLHTEEQENIESCDHHMPLQLQKFSDDALNDLQVILESLRSANSGESRQIIGISGIIPQQGSSTITALLSLMLAGRENGYFQQVTTEEADDESPIETVRRKKQKVLLIDTQVRNPSFHRMFEVKIEGGLSELLYNELSLEEVTRQVSMSYLELITTGQKTNFRFNEEHIDRFRSILDGLRTRYQHIFLDIPPILNYAEGLALSKICDGVILVIEADRTRVEVIQEAMRMFEKSGVDVLGAVLNKRKYHIPEWLYRKL